MKKTSSTLMTLVLVVAIIVVVNYIVGGLRFGNQRIDLTENRIYTLSDGTRKIIKGLNPDQPVNIRMYVTRDAKLMPPIYQNAARNIEDLLLEFEKASNGKITLERIDPRPNTEDEDRAIADDVPGHQVNMQGEKVYFGLVVQSLQQKEVLDPGDEITLEYQIARALAKVTSTKRPVVGIMSPMPIAGPQFNFPAMMQQQQQQQPWLFVNQLRLDYDVREIQASGEPIDSDVNVLLLVHPADISAKVEFAIDQYLLRGGKVIALVDPQCLVAERYNSPGQMGRQPSAFAGPTSDLPNLFKSWGINYNKNMVVADASLRMTMQGRPQETLLNIGGDYLNSSEIVTASLQLLNLFSTGAFEVVKKDGITAINLVQSSENSELIDSMEAQAARDSGLKNFMPGGKRLNMAVRLSGKFTTAFPDGEPKDAAPASAPRLPGETGGAQEDASAPKPADASPEAPAPAPTAEAAPAPAPTPVPAPEAAPAPTPAVEAAPAPASAAPVAEQPAPASATPAEEPKAAHLKESQNGEGVVFLVGDADFLYEGFYLSPDRSGRMINGNLPFVLNMVEMLAGGSDLIAVRSRASTSRPFTRMDELRSQVESEYRPLIEQSNKKLNDIVQKIADLGGIKEDKGMVVLNINQEQRDQLLSEQANIQRDLRNLQKQQNSRKDRLEMTITLLNLLAVPALVVAFGVILAVRRSTSQAAR